MFNNIQQMLQIFSYFVNSIDSITLLVTCHGGVFGGRRRRRARIYGDRTA